MKKIGLIILIIAVIAVAAVKIPRYYVQAPNTDDINWGVTFSKPYAESLGLNWKEAYIALLDDLGVDHVRIPVYWNDIEKERSSIDLTDYLFMVREAEKRDVDVILAIGERLPRWPECHTPLWAETLSHKEKEEALFSMLEIVMKSFVEYDAITHWQVENEPLVRWFGTCDALSTDTLKREIAFVKTFDARPILITDSGEFGFWKRTSELGGDLFGFTVYRVTWNPVLRFVRYPFPPAWYRIKASIANIPWGTAILAELQAEPWIPGDRPLVDTPLDVQYASMNREQFEANIAYGRALNPETAYLWGAEWWFWLKQQGDDTIWDTVRVLWQ